MEQHQLVIIGIYIASLGLQLWATLICTWVAFQSAKVFRWAWLLLAAGLGLLATRLIHSLYFVSEYETYSLIDALMAAAISILLLLGVLGIKRLLVKSDLSFDLLTTLVAIDPLTKALSRTEINHLILDEINRSNRYEKSFALLEVDIDHFKDINDLYGHQVGDEILIGLVNSAKSILRSVDSLGRIGGEEFLILLPETHSLEVLETADRLRLGIANTEYVTSSSTIIHITVSIGIKMVDPMVGTGRFEKNFLSYITREADMAMYQAKSNGRNRVCMRESPMQSNRLLTNILRVT